MFALSGDGGFDFATAVKDLFRVGLLARCFEDRMAMLYRFQYEKESPEGMSKKRQQQGIYTAGDQTETVN